MEPLIFYTSCFFYIRSWGRKNGKAIADDPLCFTSNKKFLEENNLKAPTSWNDILDPVYKNMIQFADARTSGTAVTRIFSILEVNNRNEDAAFDYMKKLKSNVQVYTKSGGGGTIPVGLGQAGMGIFFIVDALKTQQAGYDVVVSFPEEGIGAAAEGIALIKGANVFPIDSEYSGHNRKRIVDRWIDYVLQE